MSKLNRRFKAHLNGPPLWLAACGFMGLALPAGAQPEVDGAPDTSRFIRIPKNTDDWTRHFRIGAVVGMNIKADFRMKGAFNVNGNNPASGIYDDGYVRPDSQTASDGSTGYWGYNNASQYNAAAGTLQMHASSGFSTEGSSGSDSGFFPGFELAYGGNLWYWKHARVGWDFGFGWLPIRLSTDHAMQGTVSRTTYTFNTGGIVVPGAPYQGGSGGSGPILSMNHTTDTQVLSDQVITGSHSLDVDLFTFRLGPNFYWDLTQNFGFSFGAGPAIGMASGSYHYDETINSGGVLSRTQGRINSTDFVFGGYVNALLMYHVQDSLGKADLYLGAQYMPMTSADFGGGGRSGRLNLNGQVYVTAGISWPF